MKYIKYLLIFFLAFFVFSQNSFALSKEYEDIISPITNSNPSDEKVAIYLFYSKTCPHCEEELEFLEELLNKNENIELFKYEISDLINQQLFAQAAELVGQDATSYPVTIIGDKSFVGFSEVIGEKISDTINEFLGNSIVDDEMTLPIVGNINVKEFSLPVIGVVLGFVDGFNPCAMWVLLFLIGVLFNMENKKRMWLFGFTFLFTSGLVYFMSMIGMNYVLNAASIMGVKVLIALVALIFGILNVKKFFETQNSGCKVVNEPKRKKILKRLKKITTTPSFFIALGGIIILAISVNLIELACSLGFPMIYSEILAINGIQGISKVLYLILYVLFYLIDDIIVFVIAMITLETTGITTKYTKISYLVGGVLMILMGLLMIFKPEWLMFNF